SPELQVDESSWVAYHELNALDVSKLVIAVEVLLRESGCRIEGDRQCHRLAAQRDKKACPLRQTASAVEPSGHQGPDPICGRDQVGQGRIRIAEHVGRQEQRIRAGLPLSL